MKRNVHNLIWDCIVFLPCLTGLVFMNEEVKKLYLVTCLVTFVQMEVFFLFLNVQHCVKKDVGAMLWLILCHYVFPMTAVISGNRLFLWLVLMVYILSQIFRDRMHFDGTRKFGSQLLYLTNFAICFSRYLVTVFVLVMYTTLNNDVFYIDYKGHQKWIILYLLPILMFSFVFILFKWMTHRKISKIKTCGITDCVMHGSIYDCIELYTLPRILIPHMELTISTVHVPKQMWSGHNTLQKTYVGRYSIDLWEYAKELPNKTCVLYWNSKKDRKWSGKRFCYLQNFIQELERYNCNIAIVDVYSGRKIYENDNSIVSYLRKYPYYHRNEMETMILSVKREKEIYRDLLLRIVEELEKWSPDDRQGLKELSSQLTGNITTRVRCFYVLMKMCEFLIHTEALYLLSTTEKIPQNIEKPSMGAFVQFLDKEETVTKENYSEVIESVRYLECSMIRNGKSQIKTSKVGYVTICEKLVSLRNRMIGHGTMVYSVSEELVEHLARITLFMLQRFSAKNVKLSEDMVLFISGKEIPCIYKSDGHICLYNGLEINDTILFLDYVTGNTVRNQFGKKMKWQVIEVDSCQEYLEKTS